jgi:hypothetical protein
MQLYRARLLHQVISNWQQYSLNSLNVTISLIGKRPHPQLFFSKKKSSHNGTGGASPIDKTLKSKIFAKKKGILVTFRRGGSAKLPEAAGVVEGLEGEHAAAAVAEDEEPPRGGAARTGDLRPAAAQEGAVAVAPDLDAPEDIALPAGGADDKGLPVPGADLLGEFVRDALRTGETRI